MVAAKSSSSTQILPLATGIDAMSNIFFVSSLLHAISTAILDVLQVIVA